MSDKEISVLAKVTYYVKLNFVDDGITDEVDQAHDAVKYHIIADYADDSQIEFLTLEVTE